MYKKYALTNITSKTLEGGIILHRIQALRDFGDVKKGDLGGWVENEKNLSPVGNCWIYDEACVFEDALIMDNAKILNNADVYGEALIKDNVIICNYAKVMGYAGIFENAKIRGNAIINGDAIIQGNAEIYEDAQISGSVWVGGTAKICGCVYISGLARISSGKWTKPPLQIIGTRAVVSQCGLRKIAIGDRENSMSWWKKNYIKVLELNSYSKEQIKEYKDHIYYMARRIGNEH